MRPPPPHRHRAPRAASGGSRSEAGPEILWLGGLFELPVFVHDEEGEPYRPVSALWVEASTELIVAQLLVSPDEVTGAIAASLRTAMESPLAGPPRRPTLIRVATRRLAEEIREAFGAEVAVEVVATPELDPIVEEMVEAIAADGEEPSYLDGGRLAPELLAELFRYARDLHRAAPWRQVGDDEPLRLDSPELGIQGGCLVVVGNVGIARGFMLFPSYAAYESFAASDPELDGVDLGGDVLHLLFETASGLPDSMRREVSRHGWPLASRRAYPVPERRERDGTPRPLLARDVEVLLLCAGALSLFFEEDEEFLTLPDRGPVTETYLGEGFSLSLTFPYAEASVYGSQRDVPWSVPEEEPRAPRVGRNDPCRCGSGRKYKRCHLAADEEARAREAGRSETHDLDHRLAIELIRFAAERHAVAWERISMPFGDPMAAMPLAVPWALYQAPLGDGASVAARYLAERGGGLSGAERSWIEAQSAAWLSIWEVRAVDPGCALTLRDVLTGEERTVREASASRSAVVYDALLARVVDHGGEHLLCGTHPRSLAPRDAAEAVRRARARLRRKTAVPVDRQRDAIAAAALIRIWEDVVDAADRRAAQPLDLRNTEGDAILVTRDYFALPDPAAAAEVARRVGSLREVDLAPESEGSSWLFFDRPRPSGDTEQRTIRGRVWLANGELHLECNSSERADALRARIEEACDGLVQHRAREHADPQSEALDVAGPPALLSPEMEQLALEWKKRHYADWIDHALPALGGARPRDAVRTAAGREAVDLLLKEMENLEQRGAGAAAFDFGTIRRQLGLA